MRLNHLNLTVSDVPGTRKLLETYFGFRGWEKGGSDKFDIVFDDEGLVLTLMKGAEVSYPNSFHIGFVQDSEEQVNAINERLKEDGFDVKPPRRFHGSWTFYFRAPGGFVVEVLC